MQLALHRLLVAAPALPSIAPNRSRWPSLIRRFSSRSRRKSKPISLAVPYVMSQAYCLRAIGLRHLRLNAADFHAERFVERPHPVGIALGQVVVDGGQMGALAFQRGQIQRQRGGERFAFAGLHLDDRIVMHGRAAQELHIEVPHVEPPPAGFAHQRERLDEQPLERLAAAGPIAQRQTGLLKIEVALLLERLFERSDLRNVARPLLDARTGETAEDAS